MPNPEATIAVDLGALFLEPAEYDGDPVDLRTAMRNAVVAAAADKLVATFDRDDLHELRAEVRELRNDLVRQRLAAEVDAAMSQPVQRTSRWDENEGDAVTIRELIRLELEAFLNGTRTSRRRDSYDKTPNNLAELIGSIANETMRGELGNQVREARKVVDTKIQAILLKTITEKLASGTR